MTFAVPAERYDRLVGRYSFALCDALAGVAGVAPGATVLDVGAGTGAGTLRLVELVGADHVAAVDPSAPFVAALRDRLPGGRRPRGIGGGASLRRRLVRRRARPARRQLHVGPGRGPRRDAARDEARRAVVACVWDYAGEMTLLRAFWDAAAALDPDGVAAVDERTRMSFGREGELAALWRRAGLLDVRAGDLVVSAAYESFDDLWEPFTAGVAPSGAYTGSLDEAGREALRAEYRRRLGAPEGGFELSARAWYAVGTR